jgi:hypothetical protein
MVVRALGKLKNAELELSHSHPITNSWSWLIRILRQAPERWPGSYRQSSRLATIPSNPCALTAFHQVGKASVQLERLADRLAELWEYLSLQYFAASRHGSPMSLCPAKTRMSKT